MVAMLFEVLWQCCKVSCSNSPVRMDIVKPCCVGSATCEERDTTWPTQSLLQEEIK